MKVNSINNYNNTVSFEARWVKNDKYMSACEQAFVRYMEKEILKGEELLSTLPEHKLKLQNQGIHNLTTKKYHKFPEIDEENTHFDNLMYFYSLLREKGNKFIKILFDK